MPVAVTHLYRYPVKGLAAEPLVSVDLAAGSGVPHDRRFAIAREATDFDRSAPRWLPRGKLVVLLNQASLARLRCHFDEASSILELRNGSSDSTAAVVHVRACSTSEAGRASIDDFLNASIGTTKHGRIRLVEAGTLSFTDIPENCLSIVNLETIRDLERTMGATLDPLRFRANLYLSGLAAWQEASWLGREIFLGNAHLRIASPIPRCATTHVNPETAERDLDVVKALERGYGHHNLGVYAEVTSGGRIAIGDVVAGDAGVAAPSRIARWADFVRFWARNGVKFLRRT
jgi:hypothetical protein